MIYLNLNILCLPVAFCEYYECVYIMIYKNINFDLFKHLFIRYSDRANVSVDWSIDKLDWSIDE